MYINATSNGDIQSIGQEVSGVLYNGAVPDDFHQTFSLGKYKFDGENIISVPGWVEPPQNDLALPI